MEEKPAPPVQKEIKFLGDSLERIRDFPFDTRKEAGYQLDRVQRGLQPDDFKPMPTIGTGAEEIRIREDSGAYRVFYVARKGSLIYVLHAFQKKSQTTPKAELDIARQRYKSIRKEA